MKFSKMKDLLLLITEN